MSSAWIAVCSGAETPVLINKICPSPCAPCFNKCTARSMAKSARCPATGISSGCSAFRRFLLVSKSLLNGTSVCALPAYTTSALKAAPRCSSRLSTLARTRSKRLGAKSLASMSGVSWIAMTNGEASCWLLDCCRGFSQLGPSNAKIAHNHALPNKR